MVACLVGCGNPHPVLASKLEMGNAAINNQLTAGFYTNGGQDWRWTARRFSVVVMPPPGSAREGAQLIVKLYFPDTEIQKIGPVTLRPSIGDVSLLAETFTSGGAFEYHADVPAFFLRPDRMLAILFELDRALSPSQADGRELGVVVSEISLRVRR